LSDAEKADLLTAMAIFAGLRSERLATELIERRRDIMIQSAAYEIIKSEGVKEGLQQGMQQGLYEGIESLLKVKFGVEGVKLMEKISPDMPVEKLRAIKNALEMAESVEDVEKLLE